MSAGSLVLFGGPAGAGKSTLARLWCKTRSRAMHVELDDVRGLIVAGLADPQEASPTQAEQYELSIEAVSSLARTFAAAGYDVAVGDVFEPLVFERLWRPALAGLVWQLVVVLPSLKETLARSAGRDKRVRPEHTRAQHAACSAWPADVRLDTTGLDADESLRLLLGRLTDHG